MTGSGTLLSCGPAYGKCRVVGQFATVVPMPTLLGLRYTITAMSQSPDTTPNEQLQRLINDVEKMFPHRIGLQILNIIETVPMHPDDRNLLSGCHRKGNAVDDIRAGPGRVGEPHISETNLAA